MSFDITLWKWNSKEHISPILCSLLLAEGIPVSSLSELDIKKLTGEIESKYPCIFNMIEAPFEIEIEKFSISCSFYSSTPDSTFQWFEEFAKKNNLFLFIPQTYDNQEYKVAKTEFDNLHNKYKTETARNEEIPKLIKEAEKGNSDACVSLGNYYVFGEAIEKNLKKAFALYQRAADLENMEGKFNLASCYRNGEGVEKNINKAIEIYIELIDTDPMFSGYELGTIFFEEKEYKDLEKAIIYFNLSAKAGNPKSLKKLKLLSIVNTVTLNGKLKPKTHWKFWGKIKK